ncbi:MAG: hypothetical protein DRH50_13375, partial [Deltaproteobacteria bacterium]
IFNWPKPSTLVGGSPLLPLRAYESLRLKARVFLPFPEWDNNGRYEKACKDSLKLGDEIF